MMMKCKMGDLAVITRPLVKANFGMLVEVKAPWTGKPGWWWVRSLSGPRLREDGTVEQEGAVHDSRLSPVKTRKPRRARKKADLQLALIP